MRTSRCRPNRILPLQALLVSFFLCCGSTTYSQQKTIGNFIPSPDGCLRKAYPGGSFSRWLQNLELKDTSTIRDFRGRTVQSDLYNVWGVVRMPLLFQTDLEQCADFAMRLWAEYHKDTGRLDRLYLFDYGGNRKAFSSSGKTFNQFLKAAFAGTNSHSLKQGCKAVPPEALIPGDMFVQNERGGIGHVSMILDICESKAGRKLYLVGYSFMPAQEFHIERAQEPYGIQGWFALEGYYQYLSDHLNFGKPVLRRFDPL